MITINAEVIKYRHLLTTLQNEDKKKTFFFIPAYGLDLFEGNTTGEGFPDKEYLKDYLDQIEKKIITPEIVAVSRSLLSSPLLTINPGNKENFRPEVLLGQLGFQAKGEPRYLQVGFADENRYIPNEVDIENILKKHFPNKTFEEFKSKERDNLAGTILIE